MSDLAYLAGFFDGEGSVIINKPDVMLRQTLVVRVSQTDPDVLYAYESLWGGRIRSRSNGPRAREIWTWEACASNAKRCLLDLLPHLRIKKERAEIGIHFQGLKEGDNKMSQNHRHPRREEIYEERLSCYSRLRQLNTRGVSRV